MNDTATIEQPTTGTALAIIGVTTPAIFDDPNKVEDLLAKLEREVLHTPQDISTEHGRDAIRSLAYKVARSKTALDDMGKTLASDWKRKADAIDVERRKIRERCDALKETVRKPLTDWEDAEAARVAAHEEALAYILGLSIFSFRPTSNHVRDRLVDVEKTANREWQEFAQRAADTKRDVIIGLQRRLAETVKEEAEAAELERLRAEQVEREQREHDAKIAEEAAERARQEAETKAKREAEEVAERAAAEQRRVEQERQVALDRAADAEARERREIIAREALEEARRLDAEEAEARAWQAAEQAERNRVAAIEAERQRARDELAASLRETAAREADENHRRKINNEARAALVDLGFTPEQSIDIVTVIARGEVPHVTIAY